MLMRICAISLLLSLSLSFFGCSGGDDDTTGGPGTGAAPAVNGAPGTSDGSKFKEGVGSGRAEDGSDEGK